MSSYAPASAGVMTTAPCGYALDQNGVLYEEPDAEALCAKYIALATYYCQPETYNDKLCTYFELKAMEWCSIADEEADE